MAWEAVFTLGLLVVVLGSLVLTRVSADLILMGSLVTLVITGVLTPASALSGFANPGVITIATLYVVAARKRERFSGLPVACLGTQRRPQGPRPALSPPPVSSVPS